MGGERGISGSGHQANKALECFSSSVDLGKRLVARRVLLLPRQVSFAICGYRSLQARLSRLNPGLAAKRRVWDRDFYATAFLFRLTRHFAFELRN
jgi:hypothetical protein